MSIWSEAFAARVAPEAGLSDTAVYHPGNGAESRTYTGLFNETIPEHIADDRQGRRERREGVLELPLSDSNGATVVELDGKSWFEIRDRKWKPRRQMVGRGSLTVWLELVADQSIRVAQPSTH